MVAKDQREPGGRSGVEVKRRLAGPEVGWRRDVHAHLRGGHPSVVAAWNRTAAHLEGKWVHLHVEQPQLGTGQLMRLPERVLAFKAARETIRQILIRRRSWWSNSRTRGAPEVMKAIVRVNENQAGIYGTVTRLGRLAVGQKVFLEQTS